MNQIEEQSFLTVEDEIRYLERRLQDARQRSTTSVDSLSHYTPNNMSGHHYLLLLSDSALPLGSFAFSSGLESYLAHTKPLSSFSIFLTISVSSYASTTLPYVLAAYKSPLRLVELDDALDATIMCTVGRRASVAQGRALLSIYERAFRSALPTVATVQPKDLIDILHNFSASLRISSTTIGYLPTASAHLGPLFGVVASMLGMSLQQTAYVFMLSHVKALLSAAVRASMFGPYQAQRLLASTQIQEIISNAIARGWHVEVEDAGQSIPIMDLWIGRHEMLYSRIFNS